MSDCGVCISGYDGDGDCVGYRCVIVHARKEWRCSECGCKIPRKSLYEYASWFFSGGGHGNAKTCLICAEIAAAFMCGGRYHDSSLWDSMQEAYYALTTACFNRLSTPQAKTELRRRWIDWKFGSSHKREARRRVESMVGRAKKELTQ
jgi:hypothetical protein